jgi:hypothetical protein
MNFDQMNLPCRRNFIEPTVRITNGADITIGNPCYIGHNTIIE